MSLFFSWQPSPPDFPFVSSKKYKLSTYVMFDTLFFLHKEFKVHGQQQSCSRALCVSCSRTLQKPCETSLSLRVRWTLTSRLAFIVQSGLHSTFLLVLMCCSDFSVYCVIVQLAWFMHSISIDAGFYNQERSKTLNHVQQLRDFQPASWDTNDQQHLSSPHQWTSPSQRMLGPEHKGAGNARCSSALYCTVLKSIRLKGLCEEERGGGGEAVRGGECVWQQWNTKCPVSGSTQIAVGHIQLFSC